MRGFRWVAIAACAAGLSSAAAAGGGILCMLMGRDVTYGKIASAPQHGLCRVEAEGRTELRVGADTKVLRLQRIRPDEIRPGEQFVARGRSGTAPVVVVFEDEMALVNLYQAMGHGTERRQTAKAVTKSPPSRTAKKR
jgi:hypothetical protein